MFFCMQMILLSSYSAGLLHVLNVRKSRMMIVRSSGDRNSDSSIGSVMFGECSTQAKTVIRSFSGLALSYSSINQPLAKTLKLLVWSVFYICSVIYTYVRAAVLNILIND